MRKKRFTMGVILFALLFIAQSAHAKERLMQSARVIPFGDRVEIELDIKDNRMRALGAVYYSGPRIKIVIEETSLSQATPLLINSRDNLLDKITARQEEQDVVMEIVLHEKVRSIMEYIAFYPEQNGTKIILRKPPELASVPPSEATIQPPTQAKTDAEKKTPEPDEELIPLVAPDELQAIMEDNPKETAQATKKKAQPAIDPELAKKRDEVLAELYGEEKNNANQADGEAGYKIGEDAPDLTSLYLMAAIILGIALIWFAFRRGRTFKWEKQDEAEENAMKVLKSQTIDEHNKLLLVEVEGRRMLLSSNQKELRFLAEFDPAGDAASQFAGAMLNQTTGEGASEGANVHYLHEQQAPKTMAEKGRVQNPFFQEEREERFSERPSFFGGSAEDAPPPVEKKTAVRKQPDEASLNYENSLKDKLKSLRRRS